MTVNTTQSVSSSTVPSTEQSGAEQIVVLMEQMRTKDALVLQLTERLEAAAEQLDRLQRSGADRRPAGGPGVSSRELAEQTGQLTCRVEEALESWGQTSSHYEEILNRLDEIAGQLSHATVNVDAKAAPRSGVTSRPAPSSPAAAPSSSGGSAGAGPGQGSFWEKMKASMIDGTPAPSPSSYSSGGAAQPTVSDPAPSTDESSGGPLPELKIAPPPVVIDVDAASIEELREAVATRDAYISMLIAELRMAHTLPPLPADLKDSGLGPEELLVSLVELETRLKTSVQRENLELALERARMGRERARLDQIKTQLEEQIKRMAAPPVEKEQVDATPTDPGNPGKNLSWLKRVTGGKK